MRNLSYNFQAHLNLRIHSFDFSGTILWQHTLVWTRCLVRKTLSAITCWLMVPFVNIQLFEDRALFLCLYRSEHILFWWKCGAYAHYPKQVKFWKHCNSCSNKQASKQIPTSLTLSLEFAQSII